MFIPQSPENMSSSTDFSNISTPSMDFLKEKARTAHIFFIICSTPVDFSKDKLNGIIPPSSSPLSSSRNDEKVVITPKRAPGTSRNKRPRHDFCNVCQKSIAEEGKRSQGTRRHILQHHLCSPLFLCPHCPATSNYYKSHISSHMKNKHKELGGEVIVVDKSIYAEEEDHWFKRCFETEAEKCEAARSEETQPKKPKLQIEENEMAKENFMDMSPSSLSSILFSIDKILSEDTPSPQ